ncbi:hypothetical protein [Candidatus Hadarchaeum sp.]|uniref:hypothetical protein n=1 Tax=Candidatus Hadarchaeum sp. TaxID=2883567 RepID=UPI003D136B8B
MAIKKGRGVTKALGIKLANCGLVLAVLAMVWDCSTRVKTIELWGGTSYDSLLRRVDTEDLKKSFSEYFLDPASDVRVLGVTSDYVRLCYGYRWVRNRSLKTAGVGARPYRGGAVQVLVLEDDRAVLRIAEHVDDQEISEVFWLYDSDTGWVTVMELSGSQEEFRRKRSRAVGSLWYFHAKHSERLRCDLGNSKVDVP